ncbi:hypothetical protein BpHYR1_006374 [Brachionus plicatilis]|uniref:Uncharacterized protein n=1 Tax=Brachionus plicatilis TaxID=10195 RepID=A0A3M7R7A8_BRAPC|nr:hypothetical protein BpHYR1_006374 [Brachionus plicatilis]
MAAHGPSHGTRHNCSTGCAVCSKSRSSGERVCVCRRPTRSRSTTTTRTPTCAPGQTAPLCHTSQHWTRTFDLSIYSTLTHMFESHDTCQASCSNSSIDKIC